MIRGYSMVVVALMQTLFICVGVSLTGSIVKSFQQIMENPAWNPAAVAVKSHGELLLLLPLSWTILCILMEHQQAIYWTRRRTLTTGLILLGLICCFLSWTAMNPYFPDRMQITPM